MSKLFSKPWRSRTLIVVTSLFLVLFTNTSFFKHVVDVYPLTWVNGVMIASLGVVLLAVQVIVFTLLGSRYLLKPLLITIVLISSLVSYFMNTYDIVVDTHMIQNVLETNMSESMDLLSIQQIAYFFLLGVVPSIFIYRLKIEVLPLKASIIDKTKTIAIALGVVIVIIFAFSKFYTSFFREHKPLRLYTNPTFYLYSIGQYIHQSFSHEITGLQAIGEDARIIKKNEDRKLVILVVGEAVRADHFSLNGYGRETTPLLKKEDIINFSQFTSSGTETAVSVPCMFSCYGREGYDKDIALHTENVLDVLQRAGANILWRDNNSDSKGVALRVAYEDFKTPEKNTICDTECRDEGMLVGLQEYIKAHPKGDIVIVLHQMGNHGPAYYKRYPKEFEKYTPVCRTNQLEQCSKEEITNGYDNALLYTDYFLSKVISLLKENDEGFKTAMFYLSDHGESLGENGLYLHGFPYAIAPDAQKHVPAVMWFGKQFAVNKGELKRLSSHPYTHDYLFHTLLGFMEVNSSVYHSELDILHGLR
ncbi:MAG: phosphoethanolamine--lipid A transferase [Sulfuricurvum sp.]|uniref:phosphoethanolamine transferase n=1 Tax=Sulfuricurvum sp. TaxID=2025608 RepID=UPI0025E7C2B3|nr:phosphoethanolamine--lipid A transferase [Sulfuricurvum sp.]MCK9374029.1 phosphoethanolamine--lipid A transferase [Sulfuricurvum sp.]